MSDSPPVIRCPAYAKVNLALAVIGRRPDGYHEVATVMQAIDLHDTVAVSPADDLLLSCSDHSLAGANNLARQAAALLRQRAGVAHGAAITLEKRIPVAAGLGGGSSDAAATLLALNELWELGLTMVELDEIAATLGSDVAFFLRGGTALATGRGERIEALPPFPPRWVVLLQPACEVDRKTATLYGRLRAADYDPAGAPLALAEALRAGRVPDESLLTNTFEKVAEGVFAGMRTVREAMQAAAGGRRVHLAGAGPTLFVLFDEEAPVAQALAELAVGGYEPYLSRTGEWRPVPAAGEPA
ncbi:MAG: 4-(cytidine 5'-diphospho)-2-C-methyl-D-erythritol kinase [Dehalococcoidales bacterium]|nr:4-(cytidine 5'-diphospho)-2-C-methyl-D-erythritol kinase [Dehalococcoidales bacterium]